MCWCAKVLNLRELFFDLRLRTFVSKVLKLICFSVLSKVLKLICFSVFFILGVAAWGPWAQATPGMEKKP